MQISAPLMALSIAPREFSFFRVSLNNCDVQTIDQIHRDRLRLLVDEAGGVGALADALKRSQGQISQWLNASLDFKSGKPRLMAPRTARWLEKQRSKPHGWMDQPVEKGTREPDLTSNVAVFTERAKHPDRHIAKVIEMMEGTDEEGRILCAKAVRDELKEHKPAKRGRHKSST